MIDALVSLFCRSNISAETLWDGGWLLRQLFPYSESEFNRHHLELLKVRTYDIFLAIPTRTRNILLRLHNVHKCIKVCVCFVGNVTLLLAICNNYFLLYENISAVDNLRKLSNLREDSNTKLHKI